MRAKVWSPRPQPGRSIRRAAALDTRAGIGPPNFSWTRGVGSGRRPPRARREWGAQTRGRGLQRDKGSGRGRGPALRVFVRTRASRVCGPLWIGVRGRASACALVWSWLCVTVSRLCPGFGGPRLVVGVGGRIVECPRTRSVPVDVSGLGVRGERVRRARHRPQLRAPLLSAGAPTWLQTFLRVPRATARSSSPPKLGGGAGSPPLFLLGSVELGVRSVRDTRGEPTRGREGGAGPGSRGPGREPRKGGEGRGEERRRHPAALLGECV